MGADAVSRPRPPPSPGRGAAQAPGEEGVRVRWFGEGRPLVSSAPLPLGGTLPPSPARRGVCPSRSGGEGGVAVEARVSFPRPAPVRARRPVLRPVVPAASDALSFPVPAPVTAPRPPPGAGRGARAGGGRCRRPEGRGRRSTVAPPPALRRARAVRLPPLPSPRRASVRARARPSPPRRDLRSDVATR
ncbi:skin secretory protein xP2-like [Lemur catta]|uniref:skin secretory protein xP2-like n=1 Tax=Lemur catta TaxID=9447 RepID=UPI001E266859|nr:skin secretory protein xP2-like [Lemur catta]